jgi:hypothetical protein
MATVSWQLLGSESSRGGRSAQAHARGWSRLRLHGSGSPETNRRYTTGLVDHVVVLVGCFGCRSRRAALGPDREVMGLALWLSPWEAQRAKQRRKPDRSGESHEHASSETGGRLPVIPCAGSESRGRAGGGRARRWKAP